METPTSTRAANPEAPGQDRTEAGPLAPEVKLGHYPGATVVVIGVAWWFTNREGTDRPVVVPELSAEARAGKEAFDRNCAQCHGEDARSSPKGPPLVHRTYQPALHADIAFELAARQGVRAHHWRFGDMPPQPAVAAVEISGITTYVRELQRANGIHR